MESFIDRIWTSAEQSKTDSFIRNLLTTTSMSVQQIANNAETNPDHVIEIQQKLQEQGLYREHN